MVNSHRASRGLGHTQDTLRKSRRVTALSLCRESLHGPYGADKFAHFDTKHSVVIQFEFFRSSRRLCSYRARLRACAILAVLCSALGDPLMLSTERVTRRVLATSQ